MKKRIPAIILMFALFLTTSYAANTYRKTITVTSGVNVEFNNEAIDMTDANGKAVEAFIYDGTTYVPIRAVSNLFGADISYDRSTQTISVYDDFSEACGVAHEMSRILSSYYEVLLMEFVSVADGGTPVSMYDAVAKIDMRKADICEQMPVTTAICRFWKIRSIIIEPLQIPARMWHRYTKIMC